MSLEVVHSPGVRLRSAICVIVKAADPHSDAAVSTRQTLARFAQHLRSSYSRLLFNSPPDWYAAATCPGRPLTQSCTRRCFRLGCQARA